MGVGLGRKLLSFSPLPSPAHTQIMDRETLLGYLMDALDDNDNDGVEHELLRNPLLREELTRLRKELVPLAIASREEYMPPLGLAERTCARIWAEVDRPYGNFDERNVSTVTFNRFRMLDEILTDSPSCQYCPPPLVSHSESCAGPLVPARLHPCEHSLTTVSVDMRPDVSGDGWRLADLVASIAVGVLIAVVAFPAINFAKHRAETMIQQSRMKDLGQSVGLYALLDGKPDNDDEMTPNGINLAASAWREVNQDRLQLLQVASGSPLVVGPSPGSSSSPFKRVSDRLPLLGERQGQMIFLGQEAAPGKSHTSLLVDVEKAIPVSDGSQVQQAYGQNILFQDGRVFFRVLPIFQKNDANE